MPGLAKQPGEVEDIFASSLILEDSLYNIGYNDGFNDGVKAGKEEGRKSGLNTGFQLGEEIGFYKGCVDLWKAVILKDSQVFSARSQRNIRLLDEQLQEYPLSNPSDERLQELLKMIRARFRAISIMLSVHLEYDGFPKAFPDDDFDTF